MTSKRADACFDGLRELALGQIVLYAHMVIDL